MRLLAARASLEHQNLMLLQFGIHQDTSAKRYLLQHVQSLGARYMPGNGLSN